MTHDRLQALSEANSERVSMPLKKCEALVQLVAGRREIVGDLSNEG